MDGVSWNSPSQSGEPKADTQPTLPRPTQVALNYPRKTTSLDGGNKGLNKKHRVETPPRESLRFALSLRAPPKSVRSFYLTSVLELQALGL